MPKLIFCGFEIDSIPTRLSRSRNGVMAMEDYAGIIGNQILKRFILTFNYKKGVVYVKENKSPEGPFTHNTSGLKIRLSQNRKKLVVDQVIEGSPAEKAGIHALDILLKVNGESSSIADLHDIRKQLSAIDEEIELDFLRGDDSYSAKLELKSWFK